MSNQKQRFFRVADANGNRAAEGLRVVEDYIRFILEDFYLSKKCKSLRHDLATCLQSPKLDGAIALRESRNDVGRTIETEAEYHRSDIHAILKANFARVQQATRSLEEFSKTVDSDLSKRFEQIRYRTYELELSVMATLNGLDTLSNSHLYVLVDAGESSDDFRRRVAPLVRADSSGRAAVDIVQLRDKSVGASVLLERCRIFREVAAGSSVLLIVNDRPDIAVLARADGVHLGQDDLNVQQARAIVGPKMLVGRSTHSVQQAQAAIDEGASYIGVGPTFRSTTKSFSEFTGVDLLREISQLTTLPAFAIGGINDVNVSEVVDAGVGRIAVSAAVWSSEEPVAAAHNLRTRLIGVTSAGEPE